MRNITLFAVVLLIISCKNSNNTNKKAKPLLHELTNDSLRFENELINALDIARNNIKANEFKKIIKTDSINFPEYVTEISIGYLFSDSKRHLVIKRKMNYAAKINVYSIGDDNSFKQIKYLDCAYLTYVDDSIYDINGDGFNDLSLHWQPTSGCCLANNYIVSLYDNDNDNFSVNFDFINPTFSPEEHIIRGFDYGEPKDISLYKYKWNGFKVDTIEYISHKLNSEDTYIKSKKLLLNVTEKDGVLIKQIPIEYQNINDFDWFIGKRKTIKN